jgi:hypothetical protein
MKFDTIVLQVYFLGSIINIDIEVYLENTHHLHQRAHILVEEAHLPLPNTMHRLDHPHHRMHHHGMKQMLMQGETLYPSSKVLYQWSHHHLVVTRLAREATNTFITKKM